MDANIIWDMVDDLNQNVVIFSSINGGAGKLAIDGNYWLTRTKSSNLLHHHLHKITKIRMVNELICANKSITQLT